MNTRVIIKTPGIQGPPGPDFRPYATRAALLAEIATLPSHVTLAGWRGSDGQVYTVTRQTAATAIADMPGWVPNGGVRPEHFGAVGDGIADDTAALSAAGLAAAALAAPIEFAGKTYSFTTADFRGAPLIGDGVATLDGVPVNAGRIDGVIVSDYSASDVLTATMPAISYSGAIVVQYRTVADEGDNAWYVLTRNARRGDYVAIRMRASPGSDTGPWELVREHSVFSCVDAFAYQSVLAASGRASYSGGGWADFNYSAAQISMPSGVTSGSENAFIVGRRTSDSGDNVVITAEPDGRGVVRLLLYGTTITTSDVGLSWPGGTMTVNTQVPSPRLIFLEINSGQYKPFSLTITNNTSAMLNVLAVNADRPQDVRPGIAYDAWAFYLRPSGGHYVTNSGTTEYALRDMDASPVSFVGGVHGREEALQPASWALDGSPVSSWAKNVPQVAMRSATLHQKTEISGKITATVDHIFGDGAIEFLIDLSGTMRANFVYFGMCKPQVYNAADDAPCFNELMYPRRANLTDEAFYRFGHSELYVWRNALTEARVYAWHKAFPRFANMRGGPSIQTALGSSTYAKLRVGLQVDAEAVFHGATAHFIHLYC